MTHDEDSDVVTYRSTLSSVYAAFLVLGLGFMVSLFPAAFVASNPLLVALLVPIPFAVWRGLAVSVRLGLDQVVIRNVTGTRRLRTVKKAVAEERGPRGQKCITFFDNDGRAVPSFAMLVWSRGILHERPTTSTDRLGAVLETCLRSRGTTWQVRRSVIQW